MVKKCLFCGNVWCDPAVKNCKASAQHQCRKKCGPMFTDETAFRQEQFRFDICGCCRKENMNWFEYQFSRQEAHDESQD